MEFFSCNSGLRLQHRVASRGGAGYDFLGKSIANRPAWGTNGLDAHPGLPDGDGGPGAAGAERISGRRNRILKAQLKGRLRLSDAERAALAEIGHRLGRKALAEVANVARPILTDGRAGPSRRARRAFRCWGQSIRVSREISIPTRGTRSVCSCSLVEDPVWGANRKVETMRRTAMAMALVSATTLGFANSSHAISLPFQGALKEAAPSHTTDVRWRGRGWGIGLGFAAGALALGALASRPYWGGGYAYAPAYYDYGYDYAPVYAYDYEPAYYAPAYRYAYGGTYVRPRARYAYGGTYARPRARYAYGAIGPRVRYGTYSPGARYGARRR